MDVVANVRGYIATWNSGGELACRNLLFPAHCNSLDSESLHTLTTAYHTLLSAVFSVWAPKHSLTVQQFVDFLRQLLSSLPSSSSDTSAIPNLANVFGDHLIDIIWTIDAQLDELVHDAKIQQAKVQAAEGAPSSTAASSVAKTNAERDKEKVQQLVKALVETEIVSVTSCRERLDSTVLASVGLIADKNVLDKKEIRTRTGIFYKQNKFNLLREQSEGYSKLITEITSSMGPAHSPQTGLPTEPMAVIESRARPVWEKVISLIGYFDLDPNRALDVILDVFSVNLTTHWSFFLALLSYSPWGRPAPSKDEEMNVDTKTQSYAGKSFDEILEMHENTKPPLRDGSNVLAQVLGFKFVYYQTLANETTPRNLFLLTALLIKEGFITTEDIYPHLLPNDADMERDHTEYLANIQSRISGAKMSALAMAAPLESSGSQGHTKPKATATTESKKPEQKDVNQKIGLVSALLALGAIRPGIAILSKFPWVVDAHPEIADLLLRIMKVSIDGIYQASRDSKKDHGLNFAQPRARYGLSGTSRPVARKPTLTSWAPTPPSTSTTDFVFFYPGWSDSIPVCSDVTHLESLLEPFLKFVGPHMSRDPAFLIRFSRVGRIELDDMTPQDPETKKPTGSVDPDAPFAAFWLRVSRKYLLPSLSLIRGNTIAAVEIWGTIRVFDSAHRWQLYGEWKDSTYKSHPELKVRSVQADKESKDILRRLSHQTVDTLSGSVGKLAHNNPIIFFTHAVNQVMAYDNLAAVVVQSLRFVTIMGFDVLVFIILDAFSNPNKPRVKDDGVNLSDWLQSLASFTGMLFRRYSTDLTPVLNYVAHQLLNDKTSEIVVLRELIWKMAGIEPLPTLSDAQVNAMAGGPNLRIQAIASTNRGAKMDPGDHGLKGPARLHKALLGSKLALPLLVQIAQQRQSCVFKVADAPLKSLASLFDTTHGVLLQYLDLLTTESEEMTMEKYGTLVVPPLDELGEKYGVAAPVCMQIIRPMLHHKLLNRALELQEQERIANEEAEKRLKAKLNAKRDPSATASRVASPAAGSGADANKQDSPAAPAEDAPMEVDAASTTPPVPAVPESPWLPELAELFEAVKKLNLGDAHEIIGPGFYLTFWQLSTYDLSPPTNRYKEEGAALRQLSSDEDKEVGLADRAGDRSKSATHRSRRARANDFITRLSTEFKEQTISRGFTLKRLAREKPHWFAHLTKPPSVLTMSLIEHCIHPRALLSPMDADFCAQFIKVLHLQGTPGFHTLGVYNKLLGDHVKVVLFSCTEYEARNYGRFLLGILNDAYRWSTDEQAYTHDNRAKVAGKFVPLPGMARVMKQGAPPTDLMPWANFKQILRKWHRKLAQCFTECIDTGEFMHVYNAIIVLKEIINVFPLASVTPGPGSEIDACMDKLIAKEERGDLKILARAYSANLKSRESLWMGELKSQTTKVANGGAAAASATAAPEKPRTNGASALQVPTSEERGRSAPAQPAAQVPSGPRAAPSAPPDLQSTKQSMESIPRPEVVKRVRPEAKLVTTDLPRPILAEPSSNKMDVGPLQPVPTHASDQPRDRNIPPTRPSMYPPRPSQASSPAPKMDTTHPSRMEGILPTMPPPVAPSQTLSAQELRDMRETARQSIQQNRAAEAKGDARTQDSRDTRDRERGERSQVPPHMQNGATSSNAPSPAILRSASPNTGSRPGTREHSADSRGSSGRMRADRIRERERDRDRDRGGDRGRSGRGNVDGESGRDRERDRREREREGVAPAVGRRDSLTHTRERANRDRGSERDERSGRDRHGDRERDKERGEKDRDGGRGDRERHERGERERERGDHRDLRDRDRDRDRHRRDDKDRDRKDRGDGGASGRGTPTGGPEGSPFDGLPHRPDVSRHRPSALGTSEEGLGKRRRGADDDSDRASKRSSRKESHRDSDRGARRPDERGRGDSDRRARKEREPEGESRDSRGSRPAEGQSTNNDKRSVPNATDMASSSAPSAPSEKERESPSTSKASNTTPFPPIAPRAMARQTGDEMNKSMTEREQREKAAADRVRERAVRREQTSGPPPSARNSNPAAITGVGSLRSRIAALPDKEIEAPRGPKSLVQSTPRPSEDSERDSRKRTVSEREKESAVDTPSGSAEAALQPQKRPKINRHRYSTGNGGPSNSGANLARRLLPIDPHAGDKQNQRRHD